MSVFPNVWNQLNWVELVLEKFFIRPAFFYFIVFGLCKRHASHLQSHFSSSDAKAVCLNWVPGVTLSVVFAVILSVMQSSFLYLVAHQRHCVNWCNLWPRCCYTEGILGDLGTTKVVAWQVLVIAPSQLHSEIKQLFGKQPDFIFFVASSRF